MSVTSLLLNYMASHVPLLIRCMLPNGQGFTRWALILATVFSCLWLWKVETFSVASLGASSSFYITVASLGASSSFYITLREILPHAFCKGGEISM